MKAAKYLASEQALNLDYFSSMTYLLQGAFRNINILSETTKTTFFNTRNRFKFILLSLKFNFCAYLATSKSSV